MAARGADVRRDTAYDPGRCPSRGAGRAGGAVGPGAHWSRRPARSDAARRGHGALPQRLARPRRRGGGLRRQGRGPVAVSRPPRRHHARLHRRGMQGRALDPISLDDGPHLPQLPQPDRAARGLRRSGHGRHPLHLPQPRGKSRTRHTHQGAPADEDLRRVDRHVPRRWRLRRRAFRDGPRVHGASPGETQRHRRRGRRPARGAHEADRAPRHLPGHTVTRAGPGAVPRRAPRRSARPRRPATSRHR